MRGSIDGHWHFRRAGDASVTITNRTPAYIQILGISIPEQTGGVFLNGDEQVAGGSASPASIVVENTLDVTLPSVTLGGTVSYAWPGITVLGDIENLNGRLKLEVVKAGAGSIDIQAALRVKEQFILAGDAGTASIGNGAKPATINPVGGVAATNWNQLTANGVSNAEANATASTAVTTFPGSGRRLPTCPVHASSSAQNGWTSMGSFKAARTNTPLPWATRLRRKSIASRTDTPRSSV